MNNYCELDCCRQCELKDAACAGCRETEGHPCGGTCCAAECVTAGGCEAYAGMRKSIIDEVNALGYAGLRVDTLFPLIGSYVNLAYPLPSGEVRLLDDKRVYLGAQVEVPGHERCWGIVSDGSFLLVCRYGEGGSEPELVLYRKRVTV